MVKYKWLLFDLDNTLLDFSGASKKAFKLLLKQNGVDFSEDTYALYKDINGKIWERFENEEITTEEIKKTRFKLFFDQIGKSGVSGEKSNAEYLEHIVQLSMAYEGVKELLQSLRSKYKLSIVTNGLKEVQRPRLKVTGIINLFDSIIVSDEIGVAKPHLDFFKVAYNSIPNPPSKSEMLMIGDSLKSDILGGNSFGIDTCWVSSSKNETSIYPNYQIHKVTQIDSILGR